jgi:hypothetical protein
LTRRRPGVVVPRLHRSRSSASVSLA